MQDPTPEQALLLHALAIFLFVAFLAIPAKQASKRSALIEIRDSSPKEGRYRARRVPNVDKSVVFALAIEWLVLVITLTLAGRHFIRRFPSPWRRRLTCLHHSPRDPRSSVAHRPIDRYSHPHNKIARQGLRRYEDRTEPPGPTSYDVSQKADRPSTYSCGRGSSDVPIPTQGNRTGGLRDEFSVSLGCSPGISIWMFPTLSSVSSRRSFQPEYRGIQTRPHSPQCVTRPLTQPRHSSTCSSNGNTSATKTRNSSSS
jgi:hypothetical protein